MDEEAYELLSDVEREMYGVQWKVEKRRGDVDRGTLDLMLLNTPTIIVFEAGLPQPTRGILEERESLQRAGVSRLSSGAVVVIQASNPGFISQELPHFVSTNMRLVGDDFPQDITDFDKVSPGAYLLTLFTLRTMVQSCVVMAASSSLFDGSAMIKEFMDLFFRMRDLLPQCPEALLIPLPPEIGRTISELMQAARDLAMVVGPAEFTSRS